MRQRWCGSPGTGVHAHDSQHYPLHGITLHGCLHSKFFLLGYTPTQCGPSPLIVERKSFPATNCTLLTMSEKATKSQFTSHKMPTPSIQHRTTSLLQIPPHSITPPPICLVYSTVDTPTHAQHLWNRGNKNNKHTHVGKLGLEVFQGVLDATAHFSLHLHL